MNLYQILWGILGLCVAGTLGQLRGTDEDVVEKGCTPFKPFDAPLSENSGVSFLIKVFLISSIHLKRTPDK